MNANQKNVIAIAAVWLVCLALLIIGKALFGFWPWTALIVALILTLLVYKISAETMLKWARWGRIAWAVAAVFAAYVASYGFLGDVNQFDQCMVNPSVHVRYHKFSFNPWMYIPVAKLECWLCQSETVVILEHVEGTRGTLPIESLTVRGGW
jgi:hypothetical protein